MDYPDNRYDEMLKLLPHQMPLRMIDKITDYARGSKIEAQFDPSTFNTIFGNAATIPETCLLEGLAQTAIIFTQMETKPLEEDEFPMLGSIQAVVYRPLVWTECITYQIHPVRFLKKQAMLEGLLFGDDKSVAAASASITVAVSSITQNSLTRLSRENIS